MKGYDQGDVTGISMVSIVYSRLEPDGISARDNKKSQSSSGISMVVSAVLETTAVDSNPEASEIDVLHCMCSECTLRW